MKESKTENDITWVCQKKNSGYKVSGKMSALDLSIISITSEHDHPPEVQNDIDEEVISIPLNLSTAFDGRGIETVFDVISTTKGKPMLKDLSNNHQYIQNRSSSQTAFFRCNYYRKVRLCIYI